MPACKSMKGGSEGTEIIGSKRQPLEKVAFQGDTFMEVFPDQLLPSRIALGIMVKDIFQPLVQVDYLMMSNPFIGIIDDLPGGEISGGIPVRLILMKDDMFFNNGGDLGETLFPAECTSGFGVIAVAGKTGGFGNVMEKRSCDHQITVGLRSIRRGGTQPNHQLFCQSGDNQRMMSDIVKHLVMFHQLDALLKRGNSNKRVCHTVAAIPKNYALPLKRWTASTAIRT